jgi:hypothetical protein
LEFGVWSSRGWTFELGTGGFSPPKVADKTTNETRRIFGKGIRRIEFGLADVAFVERIERRV